MIDKYNRVEITRDMYFKLKEMGYKIKFDIYAGGQKAGGNWFGKIYYARKDVLEEVNNLTK